MSEHDDIHHITSFLDANRRRDTHPNIAAILLFTHIFFFFVAAAAATTGASQMGIAHHWKPTPPHDDGEAPPDAPGAMRDEQGIWAIDGAPAPGRIVSPDAARLILQTHDNIFSGRAPTIASSILCGSPAMDIALADPGPQWRLLRRVCTSQLFAPKCLLAFR